MLIRSITCFIEPHLNGIFDETDYQSVQKLASIAGETIPANGYELQSARLATTPFSSYMQRLDGRDCVEIAQNMEFQSQKAGFTYLSLGPAQPSNPESYEVIPSILRATDNVFMTGMIASENGISLPAVRACAQIMHEIAGDDPNGFSNLYFSALANVVAGAPFLPSAYHGGGAPGFAFALEAADLPYRAFMAATSLMDARHKFIRLVEEETRKLSVIADTLSAQAGLRFLGFDMTPAPFVEIERSVGAAMEALGIGSVGEHGSLSAAAFIMDALDRAEFPRTGFNGLMLPVLEDAVLAERAAQGVLTLKDLLMMSAVCGTGLDTVPLPGDISVGALAAILLDVASLSQRLSRKPLTARLMPVPGKKAGEETTFRFDFFKNTRIMAAESTGLSGFLAEDDVYSISPRRQ
ncbi:MAG: DUF711 family protein [Anaerolineaceae bacterium]|nr:DUF711 family protein [Anaerolineaceae bacterium]